MSSLTTGIQLAPLLVDIKVDIASFKSSMDEASSKGVTEAKRISKELSNVSKVGENLSKVGSTLTKKVSLPLAGVGILATKVGMDFESGMSQVAATMGFTADEIKDSTTQTHADFEKLKKAAKDMGATTQFSATEASEALNYLALAGYDVDKAVSTLPTVLNLAAAGGIDLAYASDMVTDAMSALGLETSEAENFVDKIAKTSQKSNTSVAQLGEGILTVGGTAKVLAGGTTELNTALGILADNGIKGAEGGTALRNMILSLSAPTDKAADLIDTLGLKVFDAEGNMRPLNETFNDLNGIMSTMNEEEKINVLNTIFNKVDLKSANALLANSGERFKELSGFIDNSNGAAANMADTMNDNLKGQLTILKSQLEGVGIQLAETLIPLAKDVVGHIQKLVDKFAGLSEEQQKNILKWGAIAMAAGPVLKLIGGGITTFVKVKSAIGGVSKALGILKTGATLASTATAGVTTAAGTAAGATGLGALTAGLGGAVVAAAPFVLAGAAIVGAGYAIHKSLSEEVVPTVDLFADKVTYTSTVVDNSYGSMATSVQANTVVISEATQNAIGAYMAMDDETTKALYNQQISHTAITEEIASDTINKFQNMANTVKTSQEENYKFMISDYTNFFNENSTLTETKEAEILANITDKHNKRQEMIDNTMNRIKEIYSAAKEANRQLTEEEVNEINSLQEQMKDNAINTLSATEEEAVVIRERMKDYQGRLTAEMASEMIKNANSARDKEIQAATEKYDETIRQASRLKSAGYITEKEYNAMVTSAKDARDEQIKAANKACEGVKKEIVNATPGIEREVNSQTGKIKTSYDRLKDGLSGFFSWLFNKNSEAATSTSNIKTNGSHYNGLNYVPFDGYIARLHKGERVLTAEENKALINGESSGSTTINFNGNYGFSGKDDIDYFMNKAALLIARRK